MSELLKKKKTFSVVFYIGLIFCIELIRQLLLKVIFLNEIETCEWFICGCVLIFYNYFNVNYLLKLLLLQYV